MEIRFPDIPPDVTVLHEQQGPNLVRRSHAQFVSGRSTRSITRICTGPRDAFS